ncbi:lztr-1, putative, partial [Ixodes scapularis]
VPGRRSKHTVVAYKDAIYVFGGDNGKQMLNDLLRFDVRDKSWGRAFTTGSPPAPRYHHSAVVHEKSMFVFGGYTGDIHSNSNLANKNDLFEYNFTTGQWIEWKFEGRMPVPRSAHGAAVYDGRLWIFAGYDGNARLNDMWSMSLLGDSRTWEEASARGDCPPTCCNFPVAVARDSMFVFSGQSGAKITNSLFQFHFKDKFWSRISTEHILRGAPAPPTRRYGHTMVAFDRHLYVFGGTADSTLPNDLHWWVSLLRASVLATAEKKRPPIRMKTNPKNTEPSLNTKERSLPGDTSPLGVHCPFSSNCFILLTMNGGAAVLPGYCIYSYVGCLFRHSVSFICQCCKEHECPNNMCLRLSGINIFWDNFMISILDPVCRNEKRKTQTFLVLAIYFGGQLREQIPSPSQVEGNPELAPWGPMGPPILQVRLPDAVPEAFELVLTYIYTDRIDPTRKSDFLPNELLNYCGTVCIRSPCVLQTSRGRPILLCLSEFAGFNVIFFCAKNSRVPLNLCEFFCLKFIVKESTYNQIVMSKEFETIAQPLMVEIIRRRQMPSVRSLQEPLFDYTGTTLEQDMESFLREVGREFCDITLLLDGQPIPAHKSVLVARCSYFEAMFRSFMPEHNTVNIAIGEMIPSLQSFNTLLRYIYYGDVTMPPEDSLYLFSAPYFYGFTNNRLQAFCKENLEMNVTFENVIQILEAADKIQATDMKKHALSLIVHHYPKVARLPRLQGLSRELLLDILEALADDMSDSKLCQDVSSAS